MLEIVTSGAAHGLQFAVGKLFPPLFFHVKAIERLDGALNGEGGAAGVVLTKAEQHADPWGLLHSLSPCLSLLPSSHLVEEGDE